MHKVKIDLFSQTNGRVYLDGVEVTGLRAIELRCTAGGIANELVLTLIPKTVDVTGLADVTVSHAVIKSDG